MKTSYQFRRYFRTFLDRTFSLTLHENFLLIMDIIIHPKLPIFALNNYCMVPKKDFDKSTTLKYVFVLGWSGLRSQVSECPIIQLYRKRCCITPKWLTIVMLGQCHVQIRFVMRDWKWSPFEILKWDLVLQLSLVRSNRISFAPSLPPISPHTQHVKNQILNWDCVCLTSGVTLRLNFAYKVNLAHSMERHCDHDDKRCFIGT